MIFPSELSLTSRLGLMGILAALLPISVLAMMMHHQANVPAAPPSRDGITRSDINFFLDTGYRTLEFSQQELSREMLLAQRMLEKEHGLKQSKSRKVTWPVGGNDSLRLPLLSIRKAPLTASAQPRRTFVIETSSLVGASCSIFQRTGDPGDMLCVAGKSIGQTIPAVNSGKPNPAVQAVLNNGFYVGPSMVGREHTLTAYRPVLGSNGAVMGMLTVSVPEATEVERLQRSLSSLLVGSQGTVFILSGQDNGSRSPVFETRPMPSELSHSILEKVVQTARNQPKQAIEQQFQSSGRGETVIQARYFEPWDWVIGVEIPQNKMAVVATPSKTIPNQPVMVLAVTFGLNLIIAAVVWWRSSDLLMWRVSEPLQRVGSNANDLLKIGREMSSAAQGQGQAAREYAGRLSQTAASLIELGEITRSAMTAAGKVLSSGQGCSEHTRKAADEMEAMQGAMAELEASNSQVTGLVKAIAGIASQSRLLALNASIEAARAGHHGSAFNRVAEEFGTLAERCSATAKNTTSLLANSVRISATGTEHLTKLGVELATASSQAQATTESLTQVLTISDRQMQVANDAAVALRTYEPFFQQLGKEAGTRIRTHQEIVAECSDLQLHANTISGVVNGKRKAKPTKPSERKSPSSGARVREGSRSALRAY